jgi:hypothetical protein
MKLMRTMMLAASILTTAALAAPTGALAQAQAQAAPSSYAPGSVWITSRLEIMPGQFETYMDWLKNNWKPNMEFLKAEGWVLNYHVLTVNNRREGEPHLILVQEWRDYPSTAQREALDDKWLARQRSDNRQAATQNGERQVMRRQMGGMEMQELVLK